MDKKAQGKTPIFKKWWFWVIIVVVIAGIGVAASNSGPKKVGEGGSSSGSSESTQTEFKVGDVISYKDIETTVTNVTRNYTTGNEFTEAKTGKEYVKVDIKIENKSSERQSYNALEWEIEDGDGSIESYMDAMLAQADDSLGSGDLAAGGKKSGSIVFQVPKDDQKLTIHYKPSFWSSTDIKIKL